MKPELKCAAHRHLARVPIEVHHVWPLGMGGPDVAANRIPVCANAHSLIHEYLRLLVIFDGHPPWLKKRTYGKKVRAYAESGYVQAVPPPEPTFEG